MEKNSTKKTAARKTAVPRNALPKAAVQKEAAAKEAADREREEQIFQEEFAVKDFAKKDCGENKGFHVMVTALFSLFVFAVLVVTMAIVVGITLLLYSAGILNQETIQKGGMHLPLLVLAFSSVWVGTVLAVVIGHIPLRPLNHLIAGMDRLAAGDFKVRIRLGSTRIGRRIARSFNALAQELENTEMLRSDFINNFSHEFKTPIVSVLGFAKLLKRGNLTEAQRLEYLEIIEEESSRLASMATNVLNLTKVENQIILTDITTYNVSEQLRNCVLLLEKKWEKKQLELSLEFNEYMIAANEELMKQVWINLLDNAVKFAPVGGQIAIEITQTDEQLSVAVSNNGPAIPQEALPQIMNKFYQADTSHASEGNGIGLAIVKKIVDLHNGSIRVSSTEERTTFTVSLPRGSE